MAGSLSQSERIGVFKAAGDENKLLLNKFDGSEGLSELFEFRLDVYSEDAEVDFDQLIGKNSTLKVNTIKGPPRYFDGIMTEAQALGADNDISLYRVVLRPWLWLMAHTTNCFIFHEKTAPDIITEVFGRHGFAKFKNSLTKSYPNLEYVVQYRESDMDFVCRLMEEHGITYFFEHEDGQHTLVMADKTSSYVTIPEGSRLFQANLRQDLLDEEHFTHWIPGRRFTSGKVVYNDYDFKKPSADMKADKSDPAGYENASLEIYEYPGRYVEKSDGSDYAETRLNVSRSQDGRFSAEGDVVSCAPGMLLTLKEHPTGSLNVEYLAIRCFHSLIAEGYRTGSSASSTEAYHGSFEMLKSDVDFVPPMKTPKSVVRGPQTAKVVGDGEIDVDEYGRILVRFHWDRESDQSRRCRLAQVWSGQKWGGIYIPRVGMEVIVEFLEADPDRPIVVGTVYNDENKPPYELPDKKTQAGIKSRSTEGGGEDNYNEIMFEDVAGDEFIRMQAEKDLNALIKNDETRKVGNNRSTTVDNEEIHYVGNKLHFSIGNSDTFEPGDPEQKVPPPDNPADNNSRKGKIGNNDDLFVGNKLFYEAISEIKLKVGSSTITMTPDSIDISSININVTASAALNTKGAMVEHKASGIMTIKAPLIKIN